VFGTSAVVGTTIPHAVGYAYAVRLRREPRVVASVFGDGATDEGVFYDSLNFAALKQLPVLFVCENNGYAIHTHQRLRQHRPDICARAAALGIEAERIEDGDVLRIAERASRRMARALGAALPRVPDVRWKEHVGPGETMLGYRDRAEAEPWTRATRWRAERVPRAAAASAEVEAELADAFRFAERSRSRSRKSHHRRYRSDGERARGELRRRAARGGPPEMARDRWCAGSTWTTPRPSRARRAAGPEVRPSASSARLCPRTP
jgi:TPP-dependent pyruvate/acetoin dehydrogenase alpha subunit